MEELLLHFAVNPLMQSTEIVNRFWECAVIDIFIDNNDRNNGNWGLLYDGETGERKLAPVYDNGNSFNNKMSEKQIVKKLQESFERLRDVSIGVRTTYLYHGHILSAKKFLHLDIPELRTAITKIVPLIEKKMPDITKLIEDIPEYYQEMLVCITERKRLYIRALELRYEYLLLPVWGERKKLSIF